MLWWLPVGAQICFFWLALLQPNILLNFEIFTTKKIKPLLLFQGSTTNYMKNELAMPVRDYMELSITLSVGCFIVVGLLLCYSYVFRNMCCPKKPKKQGNRQSSRRESISMKYLTQISSQPTDTSIAWII